MHEIITFLLVILSSIHRLYFFSLADSAINFSQFNYKKTSPRLKYVATLPCNLSLMACFADINVSQCGVATYARCVGNS